MIILIILIIVLLLSLILINKTLKKKDNILEDVKLQENTIKNDGFALMLQKEDGTYTESTSSSWPTDMNFNSELSGCVDVNGNKIYNSLSFDSNNNLITVQTNTTSYCYVYFDLKQFCNDSEPLGECLIRKNSDIETLNNNVEGGLYRYQGISNVVNNNYICFGTSDTSICTSNPNKYMYRIIGVNSNKQIKVIKSSPLSTTYAYHSSNEDKFWNDSNLYNGLNGSYFLTNTTYSYMQDTNWTDKIYEKLWKHGYLYDTHVNKEAEQVYELETDASKGSNFIQNVSAKISLMYISDYFYSTESGGTNCSAHHASACSSSWLTPSNNEWTMQYYGNYLKINNDFSTVTAEGYSAWFIYSVGFVDNMPVTESASVRPVFYLNSDVLYKTGTGTATNPYMIE